MKLAILILGAIAAAPLGASATTLPADTPVPARLTLLPANGPVGRVNPFYRGYSPVFAFAGSKAQVVCEIELIGGEERVVPGQTVDVHLRCAEAVAIDGAAPTFIFREGGRKVGEGELRLTAR